MKKLIFAAILLMSMNSQGKTDSSKTGYYVVIDYGKEIEKVKTISLAEVYALAEQVVPGNCINIEKQLKKTKQPSFEMYVGDTGIYIELRTVVKIRKNGTLKMRRYK
jgi:hypothetical protein